MSEENAKSNKETEENIPLNESVVEEVNTNESQDIEAESVNEPVAEEKDWKAKCEGLNDKYLRLYSEFDNYRKRTQKEKADWNKLAGEDIFKAILPVIDDFERALRSFDTAKDIDAVKEGVNLIYSKLKHNTTSKGLEAIDSIGQPFDADLHEALTNIPAPTPDLKGKVIDEIEKCYKLNGKVIRWAKVVVGN